MRWASLCGRWYDNADERLEPYGRELGLVGDAEWSRFNSRRAKLARLRVLLKETKLKRGEETYAYLTELTGQQLGDSITLAQLALRPSVGPEVLAGVLPAHLRSEFALSDFETARADHLYAGYLESQAVANRRLHQHDSLKIPADFRFGGVPSLSHEIVERLERARPGSFGHARTIPGMTPAALSNLLVHLTASQANRLV